MARPLGTTQLITPTRQISHAVLTRRSNQAWGAAEAIRRAYPDSAFLAAAVFPLAHLAVPLLCSDDAIGAILLVGTRDAPFTDSHVELAEAFAAQAVIAAACWASCCALLPSGLAAVRGGGSWPAATAVTRSMTGTCASPMCQARNSTGQPSSRLVARHCASEQAAMACSNCTATAWERVLMCAVLLVMAGSSHPRPPRGL